jgi:phosphomannomutase
MVKNSRILCLFDVDGTLTIPRKVASPETIEYLAKLRERCVIGVVGGSDLVKQMEQLGDSPNMFDYCFPENGLLAMKNGKEIGKTSFLKHVGEENLKKLTNFILGYFAKLDIPQKRGTFIEFRNGMLNVSAVGRNCSREERNAYEQFDLKHKVRETMVAALKKEFPDLGMKYSIGGQISFDVFPEGWDKTYCLRYLPEEDFDEIHFFGDKFWKGGNDNEIYEHKRTIGHAITEADPLQTLKMLAEIFPDLPAPASLSPPGEHGAKPAATSVNDAKDSGVAASASSEKNKRILCLFDVDGTLTIPRKRAAPETIAYMKALRKKISIGVVGGSDLVKQMEQLGDSPQLFDYCFPENGLLAMQNGVQIGKTSFLEYIGEEKLKKLINFMLNYFSQLDLPQKRGTFIEFRNGMLNVSPIGRNCSRAERNAYEKYDLEHDIRKNMVEALKTEFADLHLKYSIGGQISFDVFPEGWDKTFCLRYLPESDFDEIHFFGDKAFVGGNDLEIYEHPRTIGHKITEQKPAQTLGMLEELFGIPAPKTLSDGGAH